MPNKQLTETLPHRVSYREKVKLNYPNKRVKFKFGFGTSCQSSKTLVDNTKQVCRTFFPGKFVRLILFGRCISFKDPSQISFDFVNLL